MPAKRGSFKAKPSITQPSPLPPLQPYQSMTMIPAMGYEAPTCIKTSKYPDLKRTKGWYVKAIKISLDYPDYRVEVFDLMNKREKAWATVQINFTLMLIWDEKSPRIVNCNPENLPETMSSNVEIIKNMKKDFRKMTMLGAMFKALQPLLNNHSFEAFHRACQVLVDSERFPSFSEIFCRKQTPIYMINNSLKILYTNIQNCLNPNHHETQFMVSLMGMTIKDYFFAEIPFQLQYMEPLKPLFDSIVNQASDLLKIPLHDKAVYLALVDEYFSELFTYTAEEITQINAGLEDESENVHLNHLALVHGKSNSSSASNSPSDDHDFMDYLDTLSKKYT